MNWRGGGGALDTTCRIDRIDVGHHTHVYMLHVRDLNFGSIASTIDVSHCLVDDDPKQQ